MSLTKRLSAATAVAAALAVAVPAGASAAPGPVTPPSNPLANVCFRGGIVDPGPLGPLGPYGPDGPYGPNGPLRNQPNPIGNAATCGGAITYVLRGGTVESFVNANLASVGR